MKKYSMKLFCILGVSTLLMSCGRHHKGNGSNDDNGDSGGESAELTKGAKAAFDKGLVGVWNFDIMFAKAQLTFNKDGTGEEKFWEGGDLTLHTVNAATQADAGKQKRFVWSVTSVKVAKGSFTEGDPKESKKCIYELNPDNTKNTLKIECDKDYPTAFSEESTVFVKE